MWFVKIIITALKTITPEKAIAIMTKFFELFANQSKSATAFFRLGITTLIILLFCLIYWMDKKHRKDNQANNRHFKNEIQYAIIDKNAPLILNKCGDKITISLLYFNNIIQNNQTMNISNTFQITYVKMLDKQQRIMIDLKDYQLENLPYNIANQKKIFYNTEHYITDELNTLLLQKHHNSYFCFSKNLEENFSILSNECVLVKNNNHNIAIIKYAFDILSLQTLWGLVLKEDGKNHTPIEYIITFGVVNENNCTPAQIQDILQQIKNVLLS